MRSPRSWPSLLFGLLLLPALPAQDLADDRLSVDTLLEWERVSDPQVAPNGDLAFVRRRVNQQTDRSESTIWWMDKNREGLRPLVEGSSPRWSHDGTRLAFLTAGDDGTEIHVLWMDTRDVTRVTNLPESPRSITWAPDDSHFAFLMQVPEKDGFPIDMPKAPKGADWAPTPKVVTRLSYRRDRQGYRPSGFTHLFVVDSSGGTAKQVTSGDFDHSSPVWTPDGTALLTSGKRIEEADWAVREGDLYRVDVASGEITNLTDASGVESSPQISKDGRYIAFLKTEKRDWSYIQNDLQILDTESGEIRTVGKDIDRPIRSLMYVESIDRFLFNVDDEGDRHLYSCSTSGDGLTKHSTHERGQFSLSSAATNIAAGVFTAPDQPREIAVHILAGPRTDEMDLVTDVNKDVLDGTQLGQVEEIRFPSPADGTEIHGWVVKPPGFDPNRKYPLILQIHGGPHGMYGTDFSFERQNHAAHDFVVLYTNPRGSTGYGQEFGNAIQNAYPGNDYDDLMGAVDHVIAKGYVDPERLFVYGGSGGGVLTCWIVGMTQRFKGAVSMFPVTNWISFVGTTDGPYWYTNFEKLPWEGIEEHWRRSPLRLVGNVTTPTMMLTGELDLRTPMAQTEEYYQALKLRKVDTVMVRVPGEYHGAAGRRPTNQIRRILYVRKWFTEHDPGREKKDTSVGMVEASTNTTWTGVLNEEDFAALHELKEGAAPKLLGENIQLGDGNGYLSVPKSGKPKGGVLVIHEWWGLNDHIRHWCDRLAADGYAALAVDLYDGTVATDSKGAREAMSSVDPERAQRLLARGHAFLANDPRTNTEKRAVLGWCFGGGWSLRHAIATQDLDAAVIYYGRLETRPQVLAAIRAPVLGVFGNQDRGIPPKAVDAFEQGMREANRDLTVLRYDANHAFANPSSARYDAASARDAWEQVRQFLAKQLR